MFSDPIQNLKKLDLRENMVVADLGAGTGFYAIPCASLVPHGKVYAVEILKDYLHTIENKAKELKLNNLEILWGNIEKKDGTKLGDEVVDRVIASNVLFQIEHKDVFIEEVKRILKKEGKVLLVDWSDDSAFPSRQLRRVSSKEARQMFEKAGFTHEREVDAGEHHYGMILKKQ